MPEKSLRERALGYLSRREYTRRELFQKLRAYTQDLAEVDALLEDFAGRGWLSESRFAEQLIHARQGRFGMRRIMQELKDRGVGQAVIEAALPELQESELERARAVWSKRFGHLPQDMKEQARQARFLAYRGFSQGMIWKLLRGDEQ